MILRTLRPFSFLLIEGRCVLCGTRSGREMDLCRPCESELPGVAACCTRCSLPLPKSGLCTACMDKPPPFDSVCCCFRYHTPVDRMIGLFKDSNQRQLGRVMAEVLAKRYTRESGCMPDIVVPVPLTKRKRRARGFNQAELIADVIAEAFADTSAVQTGKRVRTGLVVRRFDSQPQKSLDRAKRRTGPKGAFAVCDRIDGASVLIVDDVVTTGATVTELTQVLKNAGARAVTVAALARTPQRDSG